MFLAYELDDVRARQRSAHDLRMLVPLDVGLASSAEAVSFQDLPLISYSGFALTSLPHKPQATPTWRREGHNLTMVLQAGVDRQEARWD